MKGKFFNKTHSSILLYLLSAFLFLSFIAGCTALITPEPLQPSETFTPSGTPTPTIDWFPATPTPTLMPVNSPTAPVNLPVEQDGIGELLIEEDFSTEGIWFLPQNSAGNAALAGQNLILAVSSQNAFLSSESSHVIPSNFYLEISVETTICQPSDQFGFDFWRQSVNDFYRLLVDCSGRYRLELIQGGQAIVIQNWETASEITVGSPAINRFGLWVYDGLFRLFINDTFQFETGISKDKSGEFAVFGKTINGTALTVRFSDLRIFRVNFE
jgi:hypothetical protein